MFDEYDLRHSFGSWRREDSNALRKPWYPFFCRAAHFIGFAMLCGYPPKTYSTALDVDVFRGFGRPDSVGSEHGKMLIILKLVEWIHAYASFKALRPQVERLMLSERFVGVVMKFPHTALRIAKLIQGEEVFRMALSHVILVFDDGYLGPDPEVEDEEGNGSDSEGDPFDEYWDEDNEDEESLAPSDSEGSEDVEESEGKAEVAEKTRYDELDEQLGHDQELVSHVTRMYGIICAKYKNACLKVAYVNPVLPKPAAASKTKLVWDSWIQSLSGSVIWGKAKQMGEIGRGDVKPETMLLRYQEKYPDEEKMTKREMRLVRKNLACMLDAAQVALSDSPFTMDEYKPGEWPRNPGPKDKYWGWNISGQLDRYRYPWQPAPAKSGTALSNIIDMPGLEE